MTANMGSLPEQGAVRMTADVLSDDRLYKRIDAGDAQSLRRLFSRHAPLTVALIAHLVGRSQAQDIVQETFLLLWNRRLHQEGSVQNWLLATAHDRAVEMVRRGEALSRAPTAGALRTIVDAGAMPQRRSGRDTRARQAVILHALMTLPVEERAPIELMYFRGLSRRQIAERLHVSLPELQVRSTDGLRRLDEALRSSGMYGPTAECVSIPSAEDPGVPVAGRKLAPAREPERIEFLESWIELRGA
jgi:RNA polymerase sigma-70 factor (ECF subfamily)